MKQSTHGSAPGEKEEAVTCIRKARQAIQEHRFDQAQEALRHALALDDAQPAAHNLLGVVHEVRGNRREAQNSYRDALNLDERYAPARFNLRQSVEPHGKRSFILAELKRSALEDEREQ